MRYAAIKTLTFLRGVFRQKIAEEQAAIDVSVMHGDKPAAQILARRQASERKIGEMETRVSNIDYLLSEDR
jgi:hypothetical protein